jgi:hypothetical protein
MERMPRVAAVPGDMRYQSSSMPPEMFITVPVTKAAAELVR